MTSIHDDPPPMTKEHLAAIRDQYNRVTVPEPLSAIGALLEFIDWNATRTVCSYCGHITRFASIEERDSVEGRAQLVDHILSCPERPEMSMLSMLLTIRVVLDFLTHHPNAQFNVAAVVDAAPEAVTIRQLCEAVLRYADRGGTDLKEVVEMMAAYLPVAPTP